MLVATSELWLFGTNTYVVADGPGSPAVVIDAPPDAGGVGALLASKDLTPVAALFTHGHVDHVGGADDLLSPTVIGYLHPDDLDLALHPAEQLGALLGVAATEYAPPVLRSSFTALDHGQRLTLGGETFEVIHTPGHTPGHCCFHVPDEGILFSGDQLFAGSVGRTDLPGGSYHDLMRSMRERILPLDPSTSVLPGHGPSTTLAAERRHNPFLQEIS